MKNKRHQLIEYARDTVGVRYVHQGRRIDNGLDCAGVPIYAGRRMGFDDYSTPELHAYGRYPRTPEDLPNLFRLAGLIQIAEEKARPGDIALFWYEERDRWPQHCCILTETTMIHSYRPGGRVVEHAVDMAWARRNTHVFVYPQLMDEQWYNPVQVWPTLYMDQLQGNPMARCKSCGDN